MPILVSDVFNTKAIAAYFTEAQSNKQPFLGEAYFPNQKKMGIDLKWLRSHKGLGVALKPSNFDAIPTIRPRGQAQMTKEQMPLFRELFLKVPILQYFFNSLSATAQLLYKIEI